MTDPKIVLMAYMWCRGMRYEDADVYAKWLESPIPSLEEFESYCSDKNAEMERYFNSKI